MDLQSRLEELQRRKLQKQRILDAVRAGVFDGVTCGEQALAPPPAESPDEPAAWLEAFSDVRFEERGSGRVIRIRTTLDAEPANAPINQTYRLPLPDSTLLDDSDALALIFPELAKTDQPFDITRVAFLDTETSGLAGGTGTVAFLIGVGWVERASDGAPNRFVVEQFLIEDFCHESAQMEALADRLGDFEAFCTYNGKSFDVPLLRTRGVLARLRPSMWVRPNLDLLHFARRLWRGKLESVSLGSVEREILGIHRELDIESALIPDIWLTFARTGRPGRLPMVLHHNAQDIASLASLLAVQVERVRMIDDPERLQCASECRGLARWLEQKGDRRQAALLYERALELTHRDPNEDLHLLHLARVYRRERDWTRAVEIWRGLQTRPLAVAMPAWIELAKYHEHQAREWETAHRLVRECLRQWEIESELRSLMGRSPAPEKSDRWIDDLQRRLDRLERKRQKSVLKEKA